MEILSIKNKVKSIEEGKDKSELKIINIEKTITEEIDTEELLSRKRTIEKSLLNNELSKKQMLIEKEMIDDLIKQVGETEKGKKIEKEMTDWKAKNQKIINQNRYTKLI